MRTLLSFVVLVLSSASAQAQGLPTLSGAWIERPSISTEQELLCANWADTEWRVSLQGNILDARPTDGAVGPAATRVEFTDGELVGSDAGEWGGQLVWRPTGAPPVQLIARNTTHIFGWNGHLFAAGGLAHLGMSDGFVAQLARTDGGWSVLRHTELPAPVSAIDYSSRGEVVLATPDGVYVMDAVGEISRVFTSSNWWALYPNSVVRLEGGDILVGMRYSISRLRPGADGYTETLLVPADCPALQNVSNARMPPCACATTR